MENLIEIGLFVRLLGAKNSQLAVFSTSNFGGSAECTTTNGPISKRSALKWFLRFNDFMVNR